MTRADIMLPGRYSEYEALYVFIASFTEGERYSTAFVDRFQLAMKEAFVNAIKHGNCEREDLTVSCWLVKAGYALLASVRDCGKGFNPEEQPNPIQIEHLFKLSGRGLYIIRSIAEIIALEHDQDGSTLTMRYIPY